ncbi:MAG: hypothetical protein ACREJ4_08290 [Candidatus Methylomirabilaceae bacterium]
MNVLSRDARAETPWWLIALLVASLCVLYASTVSQPFDFEDDGNLVYSSAPHSGFGDRLALVWSRTLAELHHDGPFRPVLWAYFELHNYTFGLDVVRWRVARLGTLGVSAFLFLVLLLDLGVPRYAAALAIAVGLLAPVRSAIWYRLAFLEALAMPMVLLALIAARKASRSERPFSWDVVGSLSILGAMLTKNVFVSALPAQVLLRVWQDGRQFGEGVRAQWRPALALSLIAAVPMGHLVYFKYAVEAHSWYKVGIPSIEATHAMVWAVLWRASGYEFIGPGLALAAVGVIASPVARRWALEERLRRVWIVGLLLMLSGILVYVPLRAVTGRYTVPAAWGVDMLDAALLSCVPAITWRGLRRAIYAALALGCAVLVVVNLYHQQRFISRCAVLWHTAQWLMRESPPEARVMVIGPAISEAEVVHLRGHLRGQSERHDVHIDIAESANALGAADLLITNTESVALNGFVRVTAFPMRMSRWSRVRERLHKRDHGTVIWRRVHP